METKTRLGWFLVVKDEMLRLSNDRSIRHFITQDYAFVEDDLDDGK